MKIATWVRNMNVERAHQALYKVSPAFAYDDDKLTEYVLVSSVNSIFTGPETYIFAANAHGIVMYWGGLGGSFRGRLSHIEALRHAGYEVPLNMRIE